MEEVFREIPGLYYQYEISNLGRVRSMFGAYAGLVKSQSVDKQGDAVVSIWNGTKLKPKKVYRLMLMAFFDENRSWILVEHKDGNKRNNRLDNIKPAGV